MEWKHEYCRIKAKQLKPAVKFNDQTEENWKFDKQNPEINIFSFLGKNTRKQRVIFVHRKTENASYGIIFFLCAHTVKFELMPSKMLTCFFSFHV